MTPLSPMTPQGGVEMSFLEPPVCVVMLLGSKLPNLGYLVKPIKGTLKTNRENWPFSPLMTPSTDLPRGWVGEKTPQARF